IEVKLNHHLNDIESFPLHVNLLKQWRHGLLHPLPTLPILSVHVQPSSSAPDQISSSTFLQYQLDSAMSRCASHLQMHFTSPLKDPLFSQIYSSLCVLVG